MFDVPKHLSDQVKRSVLSDLNPSLLKIYVKSGIAVVLGGFLSLLVSGELGLGISHAAAHLMGKPHAHPHIGTVCGGAVLFAILPALIMRALCSSVQFQAVLRRSFHAPLIWFIGLGGILAHHGEFGHHVTFFVAWVAISVLTFGLVGRGIDPVLRFWPSLRLSRT